jgi:hypothetical protein
MHPHYQLHVSERFACSMHQIQPRRQLAMQHEPSRLFRSHSTLKDFLDRPAQQIQQLYPHLLRPVYPKPKLRRFPPRMRHRCREAHLRPFRQGIMGCSSY